MLLLVVVDIVWTLYILWKPIASYLFKIFKIILKLNFGM